MTNLLSRSFPPLSNWQDFERLCFDLYSRVWQTNDAQMHGRVGQPQSGVDIYGNDRVERKYVGVQCKGKDQGYNNPLTAAELREEVEKAKSFQPALDTFILATTAPNDEAVQQVARHLTEAHQKVGLFEVRVEGWTTIRQRISDYPIIVAKYFADFSPVDIAARIDTAANLAREDGGETRALLRQNQTAVMALLEKTDSSDRLQMRITDTAKLIEDGMPAAGLKALNRLWSEESTHASPRNRYLMRANIGFAHLKLGDKARSIAELRQAAAEDPTWPNAQAILATAEMLDGHREIAFEIAKTALAMDSGSQQAAIVIVESAPVETTTTELQAMVPPAHMQRLDMLLTFAQRARQAGENALRTDFVARAATLFPQNWRVLAVQAEVLLEPIFAQDGMAVTHAVPAGRIADLEQAIALLRQAWDHLTTRDDARIGAHVAANLLSALEIAGRREEYEALLTKALNIAPTFYPLLRCYARSMIAADDWVAAGKALDAMPL